MCYFCYIVIIFCSLLPSPHLYQDGIANECTLVAMWVALATHRAAVLAGLSPLPRAQTARLRLGCVHNTPPCFLTLLPTTLYHTFDTATTKNYTTLCNCTHFTEKRNMIMTQSQLV